jgi:serine/threonine-protein kinase
MQGEAQKDLAAAMEAAGFLRVALAVRPQAPQVQNILGIVMFYARKWSESEEEYRKAIELQPGYATAYSNLGCALKAQGKLNEAEVAYRKAIELQPELADANCNLGDILIDKGHFTQALLYLRRGHELGSQKPQAWPHPSGQWVRDCERLIELDAKLPRILKAELQPVDAGERLELAALCQRKSLYAAACRFYADAFAQQPRLADNLNVQHRYNAACTAVLRGCGQRKDVDQTDAKERARWRAQALDWLRADLAAYRQAMDKQPEKAHRVQERMQHWQQDNDFAGVRGDGLTKLPEAERREWQHLWDEVEALRRLAAEPAKKAGS